MADYDTNTESQDARRPATGHAHTGSHSQATDQAAEQMRRDARAALNRAKGQMSTMLTDRKRVAAGQVTGLAEALRTTAEQLYAQEQRSAAQLIDRAAGGLQRLGDTLRERDVESLAAQVQDFARKQPGVVFGGALAAGFLIARFLKSSSPTSSYSRERSDTGGPRDSQAGSSSESIGTPSIGTPT